MITLHAFRALGALAGAAFLSLSACKQSTAPTRQAEAKPASQAAAASTVHGFTLQTIDGQERSLGDYQGRVLLIVNTASQCGYTPQYAGLQRLQERYAARGFSVLGFPSNDFGGQEPGSEAEIQQFCSTRFGVNFPLFAKITVKGPNKHPLFALLTAAPPAGEVKWNFTKFLVGKDGAVLTRYDSAVTPEDPQLVAALERALGT